VRSGSLSSVYARDWSCDGEGCVDRRLTPLNRERVWVGRWGELCAGATVAQPLDPSPPSAMDLPPDSCIVLLFCSVACRLPRSSRPSPVHHAVHGDVERAEYPLSRGTTIFLPLVLETRSNRWAWESGSLPRSGMYQLRDQGVDERVIFSHESLKVPWYPLYSFDHPSANQVC